MPDETRAFKCKRNADDANIYAVLDRVSYPGRVVWLLKRIGDKIGILESLCSLTPLSGTSFLGLLQ